MNDHIAVNNSGLMITFPFLFPIIIGRNSAQNGATEGAEQVPRIAGTEKNKAPVLRFQLSQRDNSPTALLKTRHRGRFESWLIYAF